jgi:hypothetical protein
MNDKKTNLHWRKRPVVVEAVQWHTMGDHPEVGDLPGNLSGRWHCDVCDVPLKVEGHGHGWVNTLESGHLVCPGDWIIKGVQGEYYPCKPDIFAKTYEPANRRSAPEPAEPVQGGEDACDLDWQEDDDSPLWGARPSCPRCGDGLRVINSTHGRWFCANHDHDGKCVWWDYELTGIMQARLAQLAESRQLVADLAAALRTCAQCSHSCDEGREECLAVQRDALLSRAEQGGAE